MNILYVNACVRKESRTNILAQYILNKLDGNIEEIKLDNIGLLPLNSDRLNERERLVKIGNYNHSMFDCAKQFAKSDIVVFATPFWDLSFPAYLKTYIENINVAGITFQYTNSGCLESLCNVKQVFYVTTSGGELFCDDFGYEYIKTVCNVFYGVKDIKYIKAEKLDILNSDTDKILSSAKENIDSIFSSI